LENVSLDLVSGDLWSRLPVRGPLQGNEVLGKGLAKGKKGAVTKKRKPEKSFEDEPAVGGDHLFTGAL